MKKQMRRSFRLVSASAMILLLLMQLQITALAYPGTVTQDNVNVRSEATTQSQSLGTVRQNTEIDIQGEVTDANGQVWYQITYNNQTGYIRGDMVEAEDGGNADPAAETPEDPNTPAAPERIGRIETQTAANVRTGPGTTYPPASFSPLQPGSEVRVVDESAATNGEIWYKIIYDDGQGGGPQEGYIRNDYLTVEAAAQDPSQTPAEQPAEAPVTEDPNANNPVGMMGQQYTVAYDMDDNGETVPYLVDNNNNNQRWRVETLLQSYEDSMRMNGIEGTNTVLKVVCVILGIITLVAVILLMLLGLRFRRYTADDYGDDDYDRGGSYDGDYDDEDDADDEEDDRGRGRSGGLFSRFKKDRDDYDDEDDGDYDDEDDEEEMEPRAIRRVYQPERASYDDRGRDAQPSRSQRRPRNFMEDDEEDDFEYGFLNDDR